MSNSVGKILFSTIEPFEIPENLFTYLNKLVKIELRSKLTFTNDKLLFGWLYTIDPVSLRYF
jgi:hypothetical protein